MSKRMYALLCGGILVAVMPEIGYSAGTYYNGNYTSPQRNYSTNGFAARQQNTMYSRDTTYTRTRTGIAPNNNAIVGNQYQNYTRVVGVEQGGSQTKTVTTQTSNKASSGVFLNAGFSHEFAAWNFDMSEAGSKLHYDNIFDAVAGYKFDLGSMPVQIDAGFRYGMQFGDSSMIDDDISNGGYIVTDWWEDTNSDGEADEFIGSQVGHALSVGTSSSGSMLGFNAGFGFTDAFKLGALRVTPSVGYRYLKYKLETKNDYGLTVDTGFCYSVNGGDEVQCDPIIIFYNSDANTQQVIWEHETNGSWNGYWEIPGGSDYVSAGGTYMFRLPGTSHSYETTWAGPYLALDLNYDINVYNAVNARIEFGLPMYTSTGDQPYRSDWLHPKSVEDKGGFGDAWHMGFLANYMTALSDTIYLSLGVTFDYYKLSGGEANTYLNSAYYYGLYNELFEYYKSLPAMSTWTDAEVKEWMDANDPTTINMRELERECTNWVCKVDNEIESVYKSMGVRIGIQAKF